MTSFQEKMFGVYGRGPQQEEEPTAAEDSRARREAAVSEVDEFSVYGAAFLQAVAHSPVYAPEHHPTFIPNPSADHATGPIDHKRDHLSLDEAWARFELFMATDPLSYIKSYQVREPNTSGKTKRIRDRRAAKAHTLPLVRFTLKFAEYLQHMGLDKIEACYMPQDTRSESGILSAKGHKLIVRPGWSDAIKPGYMTAQVLANLGIWTVFEDLHTHGETFQRSEVVARYNLFAEHSPKEISVLGKVAPNMSAKFFDTLRGIEYAAGYQSIPRKAQKKLLTS